MLACSWSESHDSVDATLHTKCGHMFRNICTVHVKFTSKKGIFTFTFKLLMHQSLLDQNPTTLIYHRFYHLLTNSFNFHRFRCLCFPVAFPGAKISFKNLVPLQKGMSSGTESRRLKLEFGKAKTLRTWHAVSWWWWWWNLIRRILGVLKIPEKPTGFFGKSWISEVKWGPSSTWLQLVSTKNEKGDRSILLKFFTFQFQNWSNI